MYEIDPGTCTDNLATINLKPSEKETAIHYLLNMVYHNYLLSSMSYLPSVRKFHNQMN